MKSKAVKVIMLTICLIFVMSLVGCGCASKEVTIWEDGFFQYIIVGENSRYQDKNNKAVAIVGFTASGYEQEVLDIPREIDGKTVEHIGLRDEGFWHYNSHIVYSENLKKVYVHDNIEKIECFEGLEVDMMLCSKNDDLNGNSYGIFKGVYFYKSMIKTITTLNGYPANIVYMNNYSDKVNEGYYRLDNIESGEKIPVPPSPVRNGYNFIGWYTESECINVWDFNVSPITPEDTEFRLYACWRTK